MDNKIRVFIKEPKLLFRSKIFILYFFVLQAIISREEMYLLSTEKFERDCAYIVACEDGLVGQAVVARNDGDGMFYLGNIH